MGNPFRKFSRPVFTKRIFSEKNLKKIPLWGYSELSVFCQHMERIPCRYGKNPFPEK